MFDCKDSLHSLFEKKKAIKTESLSSMSSKIIAIDSIVLLSHFTKSRKYLAYRDLIKDFKRNLDKYDIKMLVVFGGKENFDEIGIANNFKHLSKFFTKLYFFKMIVLEFIQDLKTKQSEERSFLSVIKHHVRDAFSLAIFEQLFSSRIVTYLIENEIDFIKAPQMRENQLLWLYENNKVHGIAASPLIFMQGTLTQSIVSFDFEKGEFSYYDLDSLAFSLASDADSLRHYIYGIALFFNAHPDFKSSSKLLNSSKVNISKFVKTYKDLCNGNFKMVEKMISSFKDDLDLKDHNRTFNGNIATLLQLNKNDVIDFNRLFSRSCVLSDTVDILYYPQKKGLSHHRYVLETQSKDMIILYSMGILDQELFLLLNKVTHHSIRINLHTTDFLDLKVTRNHIYIPKLKTCISLLLRILQTPSDMSFNITFGKNSPINFSVSPHAEPPSFFETNYDEQTNFFSSIAEFHKRILAKSHSIILDKNSHLSTNQIFLYLYLELLNNLKYINKKNSTILPLGAALAELGTIEFIEEIIIIFELFKVGSIKPRMFNQQTDNQSSMDLEIFSNNYLDDLIENTFNFDIKSNQSQVSKDDSEISKILPKDQSIDNSFSSIFDTTLSFVKNKSSAKSNIVEKTVNMLYKTIKHFLLQYKQFYGNKFCQKKLDLVLKNAYKNNKLGKIVIISRFYLFVKTWIYIEDYYDYDECQFDALMNLITIGIRQFLTSKLIFLFFETGLKSDLSSIYEIFKKLPFITSYRIDGASLIKTKLTEFILWRGLVECGDEFADTYVKNLDTESTKNKYSISGDITKFYQEGNTILVKSLEMLQICKRYGVEFEQQNLIEDMIDCKELLGKFLDYQNIPYPPDSPII